MSNTEDEIGDIMKEAGDAVDSIEPLPCEGAESAQQDAVVLASESMKLDMEKLRNHAAQIKADFDNYKKRQKRDFEDQIQRAIQSLLIDFLPLGDNLSRAKRSAAGDENIWAGIEMVSQAFLSALNRNNIHPIPAVGELFDPSLHEALSAAPSDCDEGIIIEEFEKGYTWNDRLLRPARVVISSGKIKQDD